MKRIAITSELKEKLEVLLVHCPTKELAQTLGFKSDTGLYRLLNGQTKTVPVERCKKIQELFRKIRKAERRNHALEW